MIDKSSRKLLAGRLHEGAELLRLGVVGSGYVGLVTAAGFASRGHDVVCIDINEEKIASLAGGDVPWFEPGLGELVAGAVSAGRLRFSTDISSATDSSEIIFVAVGTPPNPDGSADTGAVTAVAEDIGSAVSAPVTVVIRSTVPVGTAQRVRAMISERAGFDCPVLSNPEFLREGKAVADFEDPTRIVIGSDRAEEDRPLRTLYEQHTPPGLVITVDTHSAEMAKYASNSFLATKISFMNEIAALCEAVGASVEHVRNVMGLDPRIGPGHLAPGIGYGGSCLPKDTRAIAQMGRQAGVRMGLLEQVHRVNLEQPERVADRILDLLGAPGPGKTVAVWGLAFKAKTDDMREAPSIPLIGYLLEAGVKVRAYDPMAMEAARGVLDERVDYAADMYESADGADALVIVTEWDEFRQARWSRVKSLIARPLVFDGRNILDPNEMAAHGFDYYSIGRRNTGTSDDARPDGGDTGTANVVKNEPAGVLRASAGS